MLTYFFSILQGVVVAIVFLFGMADVYAGTASSALTVMTFNIENGGTQVDFNQVVNAVKQAHADVVGIQEAWGNTARLAKELGWQYYDPAQSIVSRYPLMKMNKAGNQFDLIEISPGRWVALANIHLPDEPYGPTLVSENQPLAKVIANEKTTRLSSALPFLNALSKLAKQGVPVFLTGDFNSPSHLDWQINTVGRGHHRYVVPWVVTSTAERMGLRDAYRTYRPDPLQYPAYTWPARRPALANSVDGYNPSTDDLSDRLDFIMYDGPVSVLSSQIIGEAGSPIVDQAISPWPSDHRAVVARFAVTPSGLSAESRSKLISIKPINVGKPGVNVSRKMVKAGETIAIYWKNAPGNRNDYIRIAPVGSKRLSWYEAVRLYTDARMSGHVLYNGKNYQGNRVKWQRGLDGRWPMKAGTYNIQLMQDDSDTVLASTTIVVEK